MAAPKTFYVTSSNQGYPLTLNGGGTSSGVVLENTNDYKKHHEWVVEHADQEQLAALKKASVVKPEDEPNVVALKSVASGKYMFCSSPKELAGVGTSSRQWWKMTRDGVTAPGAWRLDLFGSSRAPQEYSLSWDGSDIQKGQRCSNAVTSLYKPDQENKFTWNVTDTSTKSQSADVTKTVYVSIAVGGYVLAPNVTSYSTELVYENVGERDNEQKWTVEYGEEPGSFALQNVATGKYLKYLPDRSYDGKVGLGDVGDKDWWKTEVLPFTAPGACQLTPLHQTSSKPVFINGSSSYVSKKSQWSAIHMSSGNIAERACSWYIHDTSMASSPLASMSSSGAASKEKFDAKLKALEEREAALAQKENDQSADLDKKAKELQERQDALDQEEKKRAASKTDFDSKLKALEDREAKLTQKDKDRSAELDKREKEIKDRQDSSEKEGKTRDAASTKKDSDRSAELDKKAKELQDRQDSLEKEEKDRQAASKKKDSDRSSELDKKAKELQEREDALARGEKDRENASRKKDKDRAAELDKKAKELQEREDALVQGEKDRQTASEKKDSDASAALDKKMKEVQDRQESLAKEEKDRAASYEKKLKDLQAREDEMAKKEKDQKKSSKDTPSSKSDKDASSTKAQADKKAAAETQRKLDDLKATEQQIAADRASLEKSQAVFAVQQEQFRKRQKAFEDKKSASKDDASQARTENAALEKRTAELEDQLTQMDNARNSSTKSGKPQANGTDVPSVGCKFSGQKHYKPPRKLGRKVIGIVYE